MLRWAVPVLLAVGLWAAPAAPVRAYVPPLDDLYRQLIAGAPSASSAILELQCKVYTVTLTDPAAKPVEDPARSFRQRVYWQRDRFLGVETLAADGSPLHVLLREGGFTQTSQLSPTRHFTEMDVRPLIFPVLEGKVAAWTEELGFWGILPSEADLVLLKAASAFRFTDGPERALWMDRDASRPLRLATVVEGGTAPLTLSVDFGDYVSFATRGAEKDNLTIPRRFTYQVNGKTFKEVVVTEYKVDPAAREMPISRLRQLVGPPSAAVTPGRAQ